jgi:hypothetical protein
VEEEALSVILLVVRRVVKEENPAAASAVEAKEAVGHPSLVELGLPKSYPLGVVDSALEEVERLTDVWMDREGVAVVSELVGAALDSTGVDSSVSEGTVVWDVSTPAAVPLVVSRYSEVEIPGLPSEVSALRVMVCLITSEVVEM